MNTDDFWSLIERAQQVADPQNEASMMEALFWELTKLTDRDFFAWYRLQEAFMQLADTPKLCAAASIINYGTSDDRFMDFRAWLVMQGRAVYLSALAAPDRLARMRVPFGEAEWELCGYIAMYAYTGRKYLALFRPDAPDGQALRRRYPDCKDLPQQVERICMNRALIRRYDVGGFDQDLEHQMLQTEIEYRLHRSNIPRDFFSAQHKDEPKEDLAQELAKTLTIDTAEVDPALPHALPALWKKRTDWEASRLQQRSGAARHKQAER